MRILYILPAEGFGGAERQGVLAVKSLRSHNIDIFPMVGPGAPIKRALEDNGVEDYVFCTEFPREMEGTGSAVAGLRRKTDILYAWRRSCRSAIEVAKKNSVDLVFASRSFGWFVGSEVARRLGLKVVWRAGSRPANYRLKVALSLVARFRSPDALICNCSAVHKTIAPVLKCPSFILQNGVDLSRFDSSKSTPRFRRSYKLGNRPILGIAARPAPEKGYDLAAKVIERIIPYFPDLSVLVAGEYPFRDSIEAHFKSMALSRVVRFLGHVEDMESFYKSCDIVLLTSREDSIEGSPNALLEAMAMECPVVSTRVGGIDEAITHNIEGMLSDPGDVQGLVENVIALISSKELRRKMGAAGRRRVVGSFSAEKAATGLVEILRYVSGKENSSEDCPVPMKKTSSRRIYGRRKIL